MHQPTPNPAALLDIEILENRAVPGILTITPVASVVVPINTSSVSAPLPKPD